MKRRGIGIVNWQVQPEKPDWHYIRAEYGLSFIAVWLKRDIQESGFFFFFLTTLHDGLIYSNTDILLVFSYAAFVVYLHFCNK